MNDKIKILHAITRLDRGGSSENTLLSAIGLARKGYEVDVLFGKTEDANIRLLKEAEKYGVDFIEEADLVRDIHPLKDVLAFYEIFRFLRDKKYDIVHTHSSKAGLICRLAAALAGGSKIIYTPHGHVFYGYFGGLLTRAIIFAESVLSRMTDKIVGLTPAECDEWIGYGVGKKEKYTAIPSGIDFDSLEAHGSEDRDLKEELGVPKNCILVGSVGRMVGVKGYEYFVKAAVEICRTREDVYFVIAGEGPRRGDYKKTIDASGMSDRFHLIGWQDNVAGIIKGMDVFVLSSLNEGMGRVLVEAMFYGKPLVATRVGGVPSVVSDGVGVLVDPASSEAIKAAIERLADDPAGAAAMGRKGREKALAGYSAQKMVDELDGLYRGLLSKK